MQNFLNQFDYGNRDISGGIDRFWLGNTLRISPLEQVAFVQKMHERRLGVSDRAKDRNSEPSGARAWGSRSRGGPCGSNWRLLSPYAIHF